MAKSTKPIIRIHNVEIDEVIDREMNDAEFAQYEADKAAQLAKEAEVAQMLAQVEREKTQAKAQIDAAKLDLERHPLKLGRYYQVVRLLGRQHVVAVDHLAQLLQLSDPRLQCRVFLLELALSCLHVFAVNRLHGFLLVIQ